MILEEATFEAFGYYPKDLSYGSSKRILVVCDGCGEGQLIRKNHYWSLCKSCSKSSEMNPMFGTEFTVEHKHKLAKAHIGRSGWNKGKTTPDNVKRKISESEKGERTGPKNPMFGKTCDKNPTWKGGMKLSRARSHSKRKQLGFIPVLSQNSGEVWHHFTNEYVIGIPEEAHNKCGGRRQRHRLLVLEWLRTHDRVKYLIIQSFKNTLEGW